MESVVEEIQQKLDNAKLLPEGYYYNFGGTFENLQEASARLAVVVPLALLLILCMLYFTFHSISNALLIFTAIPMSAIGGVFALLLRGMPFSISAGVGFIALFGVAVLNGIVLISTFNQLKKEGVDDVVQRVLEGTRIRLRPVLMTACVAALGFMPMALSTGAGAEVQKPLATVVIGGLLSATLLTLVVLPCLYIILSGRTKKPGSIAVVSVLAALIFFTPAGASAQQRISLQAAVDTALSNNLQYKINESQIHKAQLESKTAADLPKTGIFAENEDLRPSDTKGILKIGLSQSISWPGLYAARSRYFEAQQKYYQLNTTALNAVIQRDVRSAYYQLWYLQDRYTLYSQLDSIYGQLFEAAALKVKTGESAGLDKIAADARLKETKALLLQIGQEMLVQQQQLMMLLNQEALLLPLDKPLEQINLRLPAADAIHPVLALQQQNVNIAQSNISVQQNSNMPDLSGRFFSQRLYGLEDPFTGFSVSVAFPLLGLHAGRNKVKAARAEAKVQQDQLAYQAQSLKTGQQQELAAMEQEKAMLVFYGQTGLQQAAEIIKAASLSYRSGEISFSRAGAIPGTGHRYKAQLPRQPEPL